jgi:hypothetical protein
MPLFESNALDDEFVWDRCDSFEGGMVSFAKASSIKTNMAALIYDSNIHITGQVRKRRGVTDLKTPAGPIVAGKAIQALKWFDTPTIDKLLAVIDGKIYSYDQSLRTWSIFIDAAITNPDEQVSVAQLSDDLWWTDSTKPGIRKWDSAGAGTVSTVAGSPAATILMSASLRLVAAGMPTAPNTLWFSDFLDGNNWPVLQAIGIGEDGDPIVAIKKWQKYMIVVAKLQSIYMVDANPGYGAVVSFPVLEVHASIGCVAKRTMCQLGQDMYFLSKNGVMRVTPQEATDTNVLVPLPVSQPIQDILNNIRWSFAYRSCAVSYNNHYLLSVPLYSNFPDTLLVYSNVTGSWVGIWRGFKIVEMIEQPYLGTTRLVVGEADGKVREGKDYILEGDELAIDYTDDGVEIEAVLKTRAMVFEDDMCPKTPYYLEVEFFTRTGDIEVYVILDGGSHILVPEGKFSLISAVKLPFTLPVFLVAPKWVKRKFPLFHLGQFREIQVEIKGPKGQMIIRSITLSAQLDSVNFDTKFEF